MNKLLLLALATLSAGLTHATDLAFTTSSFVYNTNQVFLPVTGPTGTNLVCALERLDLTNQTWQTVSTYSLSNGTAYPSSTLIANAYGIFRTRSTNNAYYSTNAFGAVSGVLGTGRYLLGNPFGSTTLTNIFVAPTDGTTVNKWNNSTTNYVSSQYFEGDGWTTNLTIGELEGFFVENYDTNGLRYLFSGLFTTNTVTKSIPKNLSIITSPAYYLTNYATLQNDVLSTNTLGGLFSIPLQSTGYALQCDLYRWSRATNGYARYSLTNGSWILNGTNTTVPLYLAEGYFIDKPTNATWNFNRPIWCLGDSDLRGGGPVIGLPPPGLFPAVGDERIIDHI